MVNTVDEHILMEALRFYIYHLDWTRNLKGATDTERRIADAKIRRLKQQIMELTK